MRIVNTTGIANDTKVYSDDGRDITADLRIQFIDIGIAAAGHVWASLRVHPKSLDLTGFEVTQEEAMEEELPVSQLLELRGTALSLAALCRKHGYADAQNAHQQTADAITAELEQRGR